MGKDYRQGKRLTAIFALRSQSEYVPDAFFSFSGDKMSRFDFEVEELESWICDDGGSHT